MVSVDCRFRDNRPCHQACLPNLPLSSGSSRRNAMKTEAVVKNLIGNGVVLVFERCFPGE